uniref:Uncharacterized protein n=1 Tax=Arundo donax TaxID=35708 RepID=A0A0A9BWQ3_ARUDO
MIFLTFAHRYVTLLCNIGAVTRYNNIEFHKNTLNNVIQLHV